MSVFVMSIVRTFVSILPSCVGCDASCRATGASRETACRQAFTSTELCGSYLQTELPAPRERLADSGSPRCLLLLLSSYLVF